MESIESCKLDADGLRRQRSRQLALAASVTHSERDGHELVIELAAGYDRPTLDELIATERECCPFFTFDLDPAARRLRIGVSEPGQRPALDAIAAGFAGG